MIDVMRVPLPKERLKAVPKEERALFLLSGYAANQINLLFKLVIFSSNKTPDGQLEQKLSGAQTQMLVRILIGTLHEIYEMVRKQFLASPISKKIVPGLDLAGQAALENLKKHFGASNVLSKLRNEHIFHHPSIDNVEAAFQATAADSQWDNDWNWFFSLSHYNSFFFMSDIVFMHGMLHAVGENNLIAAQEKIMAEIKKVSDDMLHFLMALAAAFWKEYFGDEIVSDKVIKITDARNVFDVWIPFFVEIPAEKPAL